MNNNHPLLFLTAVSLFVLSACGGGDDVATAPPSSGIGNGSNGGGTSIPALSLSTVNALPDVILENDQAQYVLAVSNAQQGFSVDTSSSVAGGNATVQYVTDGDKVILTVTAGAVDYASAAITTTVTVTDGTNRKVTHTSKAVLKDNTAGLIIAKISGTAAEMTKFSERTQSLALVNKLSEIAMVMGETIDRDYGTEFQAEVNGSDVKALLDAWIISGPALIASYNAGQVGETALNTAMNDILTKAQIHSEAGVQVLAEVAALARIATGYFTVTGVYLDEVDYGLSMFEGNPALGSYQNGVWQYAAPVSFLAAIVGTDANMCSAN